MSTLSDRLKAAIIGFGVTATPLFIIAVTQFFFIPQIVVSVRGLDSNEQAWAVSSLQKDWLTFHAVAVISVAVYWLLTAIFGKGQFLRLRAANVPLALFVFAVMALALALALHLSIRPQDVELRGICLFLGISDTDAPPFGFDPQSSCSAFIYGAHQVILLGLLVLPIPLLVFSFATRIISSRRATLDDA
ncbi:hypothetical protein [Sphingomonas sp. Leaf4]|uniref:hypothetical protein n=1 Tax=Sphingomonas sp. Leaf4 TaxID=2876553 RepID=UPI001E4239C5|nr:hypothetical protein [Sphingomonas sp. Leaf4]